MFNFYVRLLDRDGEVQAEKSVFCDHLSDLWHHAGALALEGSPGDRLHLADAAGSLLAIMGVRAAQMLGASADCGNEVR